MWLKNLAHMLLVHLYGKLDQACSKVFHHDTSMNAGKHMCTHTRRSQQLTPKCSRVLQYLPCDYKAHLNYELIISMVCEIPSFRSKA